MTKQHFEAMAAEFKDRIGMAQERNDCIKEAGIVSAIHGFCHVAEKFNPRFDRTRFLKACGIGI